MKLPVSLNPFWLRMAAVVGLCLAWLLVGDAYFNRISRSVVNRESHIAFLRSVQGSPRVFLLGDSHFAFGIQNSQLPKHWFNLGYPGDTYSDMLMKLYYAESKGCLPQTVILQLDPHKWTYYNYPSNVKFLAGLFSPASLLKLPEWSKVDLAWYGCYARLPAADPVHRERVLKAVIPYSRRDPLPDKFQLNAKNDWETYAVMEWPTFTPSVRNDYARFRIESHFPSKENSANDLYFLQCVVDFCAQRKIQLIGLQMPVTPEYAKLRTKAAIPLPSGLWLHPVLNWSDSLPNPEAFMDPNHLVRLGAVQFTNRLVQDAKLKQLLAAGGVTPQ
jgi:hypothetical protein